MPMEIKLADVLFFAMRKNLMLFKDLANPHVHYSMFFRGSLIDFHKTLEGQDKHIPLAEIEFDWKLLMERIFQEMRHNWQSIIQNVKTDDPQWADLEVDFIPVQVLGQLFPALVKGVKWNVDVNFLEKLERAISCSRLGELVGGGLIIGTGSGYFVMSDGFDCFLFDMDKISKIVVRSFELSLTKIRLWKLTSGSILEYLKLRLLVLNNSAVRFLRKL